MRFFVECVMYITASEGWRYGNGGVKVMAYTIIVLN